MTHLRLAVLLPLLAAVSLLAACGGDDDKGGGGGGASSGTDVNELLTQTFTGAKKMDSGKLDVSMKLEATGGQSQVDGPISVRLAGPFESQGKGKLPKFKLDMAFEGAGQSIKAGATSTGEKGYVAYQGTDYVLSDQIFDQFKASYEQAAKQGQESAKGQSFASLGMDPRKWLTNPRNAGEAKVGEADTIKITGGVDLNRMLDDVDSALAKAQSLGLSGAGQVPQRLTDEQKRQVVEAVKDPRVEIYTGKDDKVMRRLVVNLGVEDRGSGTSGTVALDVSITDLNESQDIAEPSGAKPFDQLLSQLGGLGALGGGGGAGAGAGAGGNSEDVEKYSECITRAGSDVDKARKCADLLTG